MVIIFLSFFFNIIYILIKYKKYKYFFKKNTYIIIYFISFNTIELNES